MLGIWECLKITLDWIRVAQLGVWLESFMACSFCGIGALCVVISLHDPDL